MKSAAVLMSAILAAAGVEALSSCILSCQSEAAPDSGCSDDYNTTLCYCSGDFQTNVKACLYENECDSDVSVFFNNVDDFCNGDEETATSSDSDSTTEDTNGTLGTCVLGCQAEVATDAGCTSNYNETSCYCDNEDFATAVKACLYQNCSSYVSVFYNYRSEQCGTENSTEYKSDLANGDATADLKSAAATAPASTNAVSSEAKTTAVSGSSTKSAASAAATSGDSDSAGIAVHPIALYSALSTIVVGIAFFNPL